MTAEEIREIAMGMIGDTLPWEAKNENGELTRCLFYIEGVRDLCEQLCCRLEDKKRDAK